MKDEIRERIRTIQASMVESARSCFGESELDDLRCVIRLTVEFYDYLQSASMDPLNKFDLRYNCESVFSGIDEFNSLTHAYSVLVGTTNSRVEWGLISVLSLKEQFLSWFREFEIATKFENKCRLLLDLFKLQIVFAGMLYE